MTVATELDIGELLTSLIAATELDIGELRLT